MTNKLISVVIAAYNAELYLQRSVDSVLSQTYTNIEVILIDDGSTDNTPLICEKYKESDSRVKVFHKQNEGLSCARNDALKVAQGEYISFIDSDDQLSRSAFQVCIDVIEKTGVDFVKYGRCIEKENLCENPPGDYNVFSAKDFTKRVLTDEIGSQLWQYLFKTSLWKDIISPKGRLAQDMMTLHLAISKAEKCAVIEDCLYYYFQTRTDNVSNGNSKSVRGTADRTFAFWLRYDFCNKNADYSDISNYCLKKATEYSLSCFRRKEFFEDSKYDSDKNLFLKNLKNNYKKILFNNDIVIAKKICAMIVIIIPRFLLTF